MYHPQSTTIHEHTHMDTHIHSLTQLVNHTVHAHMHACMHARTHIHTHTVKWSYSHDHANHLFSLLFRHVWKLDSHLLVLVGSLFKLQQHLLQIGFIHWLRLLTHEENMYMSI